MTMSYYQFQWGDSKKRTIFGTFLTDEKAERDANGSNAPFASGSTAV